MKTAVLICCIIFSAFLFFHLIIVRVETYLNDGAARPNILAEQAQE